MSVSHSVASAPASQTVRCCHTRQCLRQAEVLLCASNTDPRPKVPPGNLARDHLLCSMTGTLWTTVNAVGVTALHTSPRRQPVAPIRVGPFGQCQPLSGSVCCHRLHIPRASRVFGDPTLCPSCPPGPDCALVCSDSVACAPAGQNPGHPHAPLCSALRTPIYVPSLPGPLPM